MHYPRAPSIKSDVQSSVDSSEPTRKGPQVNRYFLSSFCRMILFEILKLLIHGFKDRRLMVYEILRLVTVIITAQTQSEADLSLQR